MFGYNDTNTYTPNPFVKQSTIVLSGAGRKVNKGTTMEMKPKDWARMRKAEEEYEPKYKLYGSGMDEMDGAGWMDDI